MQCLGSVVRLAVSTRSVGDFNPDHVPPDVLEHRRRQALDLDWSMPAECHGIEVLEVERPGEHDGALADGLVTEIDGAALGIWTGDCAAVALVSSQGRFGVAHAGWRGLALGMIDSIIESVGGSRQLQTLTAVVGPLIGPCCYEFSRNEAQQVAAGVGAALDRIWYPNSDGRFVLDLREAIRAGLVRGGLDDGSILFDRRCTGCDPSLFSFRMGGESGRQVLVVWRTGDE